MTHDWDLVTRFCRRCGASETAVVEGARGETCDEGVVGISHARSVARLRGLVGFDPPIPIGPLVPSIGGFRFPDGSLDDCAGEDDGPSAA